jgi:hypothetical protein
LVITIVHTKRCGLPKSRLPCRLRDGGQVTGGLSTQIQINVAKQSRFECRREIAYLREIHRCAAWLLSLTGGIQFGCAARLLTGGIQFMRGRAIWLNSFGDGGNRREIAGKSPRNSLLREWTLGRCAA